MSSIIIKNISYEITSGEPILKDLSFLIGKEKSGLVGKNGIGKTTLLRLIVGELEPTRGVIERKSSISYLPQDYQFDLQATVGETLEINQILEYRARQALDEVGLLGITFDRLVESLSGGERMKVIYAKLLINPADILILDEPTNNLDREAKESVYSFIQKWPVAALIVSHDRKLLNMMDRILELNEKGLTIYGGNYDFYNSQRTLQQEALSRHLSDAEKKFRKAKHKAQEVKMKQVKRSEHGRKTREKLGLPKIIIGAMKRHAQRTTGKLKILHEERIENAQKNFETARANILPSNTIYVDLSATAVPSGKLVAKLENVSFSYPEKEIFQDLNLVIHGPERIAINGPNGSGKTTLVRLLVGDLSPSVGVAQLSLSRYTYLDQSIGLLDQDKSILENLKNFYTAEESKLRRWLGQFLFEDKEVFKEVKVLSGGERMRAALACILAGETPPQLIILDEPTNNLDLNSIEKIESALLIKER